MTGSLTVSLADSSTTALVNNTFTTPGLHTITYNGRCTVRFTPSQVSGSAPVLYISIDGASEVVISSSHYIGNYDSMGDLELEAKSSLSFYVVGKYALYYMIMT